MKQRFFVPSIDVYSKRPHSLKNHGALNPAGDTVSRLVRANVRAENFRWNGQTALDHGIKKGWCRL